MPKNLRPTAKVIRFVPPDLMTWEEARACGLRPIPPDAFDGYHDDLAPVIDLRCMRTKRIPRDR